jgi:hypothetical protein
VSLCSARTGRRDRHPDDVERRSPASVRGERDRDGCSYANRKVLIKGVGENLLPPAESGRLCRPRPSVAAPGARNCHIDPSCHLVPSQAFVAKLKDLLRGGGMRRRTAATHDDTSPTKLLAHWGRGNAQLGTDLAQAPTLGVQVGCTLNVHGATVTTLSRIGFHSI